MHFIIELAQILKVNFEEFLDYLDILLNGSVDEKNELTYYLIDTQKKGYFNIEDLKSLVLSIVNIWLVFSGNQISNYLLYFRFY